MPTDTRDRRVILAVACPECGADQGERCRNPTPHDTTRGPIDHRAQPRRTHGARRRLWQQGRGPRASATATAPHLATYTVRWQGPAPERCDWPHRQVGEAAPTAEEREHGIADAEPLWEATVTAPTDAAALAAIWGCYSGEPIECAEGSWEAARV